MFEWAPISKSIQVLLDKRTKSNAAGGHSVVLDSERTKIYTDYYKAHEGEHPILKRAHCLYEWAKKQEDLDLTTTLFLPAASAAVTARCICMWSGTSPGSTNW